MTTPRDNAVNSPLELKASPAARALADDIPSG